ncbi:MAG: hypothetical protein JSR45_12120 [Proteobacteria bacterium]|nr:hypothetical protein [Pseudomonadota bacterium]
MSDEQTQPKAGHDPITVMAIAAATACIAAFAHEAAGHGGACLALGGRITQLTSVYFHCKPGDAWIAAGGPIGNLVAFALIWLGLRALPVGKPHLRLMLLLLMAFSIFWAAGYLPYSMWRHDGDYYFAAKDLIPGPEMVWHWGGIILGVVLYLLGAAAVTRAGAAWADQAAGTRMRRLGWLAGTVSAVAAAALYAPDRKEAMAQAFLEVGAASLPLLLALRSRAPGGVAEAPVGRSLPWIAVSLAIFAAFAATLGRGLP